MKIRLSTMLLLTLSLTVHAGWLGDVEDWFVARGHDIQHVCHDVGDWVEHDAVPAVVKTWENFGDDLKKFGEELKKYGVAALGEVKREWNMLDHALYPVIEKTYTFKEANGGKGKEMTYSMYVPSGYDASKPCKMIVALHGLYSNPDAIIRYPLFRRLAEHYGYIIVCPYGYDDQSWYGAQAVTPKENMIAAMERAGMGDNAEAWTDKAHGKLGEDDVWNVIAEVKRDYNIDDYRTYLFGHSMGGGACYYLASKRPEMFAAVGTLAPAIYADPSLVEKFLDVPVICCQGGCDQPRADCETSTPNPLNWIFAHPTPGVDPNTTQKWVDRMQDLNMHCEYVVDPFANHITIILGYVYNVIQFFIECGPRYIADKEPQIDNSTVYAIRNVSSGTFLDGRLAGYAEPELTNRNPNGDVYLNWTLRSVDRNVGLVSVSSGAMLDSGSQIGASELLALGPIGATITPTNPYLNPASPFGNSCLQWKLEKAGESGRFTIKSVHSGRYLGSAHTDGSGLKMAAWGSDSDKVFEWEFIRSTAPAFYYQ